MTSEQEKLISLADEYNGHADRMFGNDSLIIWFYDDDDGYNYIKNVLEPLGFDKSNVSGRHQWAAYWVAISDISKIMKSS